MAAAWLGTPPEAVPPEARDSAKAMVYGMVYGRGAASLAAELRCSEAEARRTLDDFRAQVPGVVAWERSVYEDCRRDNYVEVGRCDRQTRRCARWACRALPGERRDSCHPEAEC